MRTRALCLAFALAGCASAEWVRDYDGCVPWTNPTSVYAVMVIDAATGKPLRDISVRLYREDIRPEALPGELVHEATTDEFGVVSFPWRDEYRACHFVFDHPGYAPVDELGAEADQIELHPGQEWRGQLLDPFCHPAEGVAIEYFSGCPHSPATRKATTDAQGRFVLKDVSAATSSWWTLWAPAPGATADFWPSRFLPVPGHVLETVQPAPGVTVEGTVRDGKGRPAPGAVVYSTQEERGPKTVARADGTFTLNGVAPDAEVLSTAARMEARRTKGVEAPPPPAPPPSSVLRLRPPGDLGKYEAFWIGLDEPVEPPMGDVVELRTTLRGPVRVSFSHEDFGDGAIVVDVNASEVDVGPEAFPVPRFLGVFDRDGGPGDATVAVYDEDEGQAYDEEEGWRPGGPGFSVQWRYQPGTRVQLDGDERAANYRVLEGPGPYVLYPGEATIELRLGDAEYPVCWVDGEGFGAHLEWQKRGVPADPDPEAEIEVYVGHEVSDDADDPGAEGRIVIRGLDAGPHILLVGAPGRRAKVLRVVLRDGERRRIDVPLSPR